MLISFEDHAAGFACNLKIFGRNYMCKKMFVLRFEGRILEPPLYATLH